MAGPAQEEADRFFSVRDIPSSHPEDIDNRSDRSIKDDEKPPHSRRAPSNSDSDTDQDNTSKMATVTQTRTAFHLPSTTHYANTGPKGVIADAQSFARAKQSGFRSRLTNIANSFKTTMSEKNQKRSGSPQTSDHSDVALSEEDSDSEFMNTWRANRIQELSSSASKPHPTRRISPSRRIWGTLQEVDANGYLDAIEKVTDEQIVVVMIFNPESPQSDEVEDVLGTLAYKYNTTRFVKLHQTIAEMRKIEVPAVLAYKQGDVFATISGAKADGLEDVLEKQRVLD